MLQEWVRSLTFFRWCKSFGDLKKKILMLKKHAILDISAMYYLQCENDFKKQRLIDQTKKLDIHVKLF